MTSLDPAAWHDFFIGSMGASAALTGLLFVAISINLEQILKYPNLPGRAAGTLGVLVSALVVACCGLVPAPEPRCSGSEVAVVGASGDVPSDLGDGAQSDDGGRHLRVEGRAHGDAALCPERLFLAGGLSLIAGGGGGLYWVFAGTALAFVVSALNAWVLLVEVLR